LGRERRSLLLQAQQWTTGLALGGVGGALGNVLGGGKVGTILGAGGGTLLGKRLDERHDEDQNRRNGYVCR